MSSQKLTALRYWHLSLSLHVWIASFEGRQIVFPPIGNICFEMQKYIDIAITDIFAYWHFSKTNILTAGYLITRGLDRKRFTAQLFRNLFQYQMYEWRVELFQHWANMLYFSKTFCGFCSLCGRQWQKCICEHCYWTGWSFFQIFILQPCHSTVHSVFSKNPGDESIDPFGRFTQILLG